MDFLKALFETGALTFEAFVAAVNAAGIKLVNLADGGYVAKEKFDGKVTELTTAQTSLAEANKAIEGFKSLDVEGIKKQVDEWKDKYEKAEEAGKKTAYDMQVKALVEKENFSSNAAKKAFLADLLAQEFKFDGETLLGYADFKKQYAESDPSAFVLDDDGKPKPKANPALGKGDPVKMTKEDFKKLTYEARLKLKEEHPELYSTLRK